MISFLLIFAIISIHVILTPFTKVEESFNIQATYDVLYNIKNLSNFDHFEFPGVVPRTFVAPLILSSVSMPLRMAFPDLSPLVHLFITRLFLGALTGSSLYYVSKVVSKRFGNTTGMFFVLFTCVQFHLLFYASRTLPNTFALILTNTAMALRLSDRYKISIAFIAGACALFRSELCILMGTTFIVDWYRKRIFVLDAVKWCSVAAVFSALLSICIDSYFWNRPCYPELEVFYFNAVENKSHKWGVSPFHWYFTSALPRSLTLAIPWAIVPLFRNTPTWSFVALPYLLFVLIYSKLPHKELRFVFYVIPSVNLCAAEGICWIWQRFVRQMGAGAGSGSNVANQDEMIKMKATKASVIRMISFVVVIGTFLGSIVLTVIFGAAARKNYPGAKAFLQLHEIDLENSGTFVNTTVRHVHIDPDAAMTGISRFLEKRKGWEYSKEENWENINWNEFEYLVTSRIEIENFKLMHTEYGFAGIDLKNMKLKTRGMIHVHMRQDLAKIREGYAENVKIN